MGRNTLTVTDNRTGKSYELPILYGTYPTYGAAINATDLRQIKVSADDFGLMTYDPAFGNTAACRSRITHHRRRAGDPPVQGLPDRATGREVQLPGDRLPGPARRAAHAEPARRVDLRDHPPHDDPREHQEVPGRLPPRRPSHGHAGGHGGRAVHVLSGGQGYPRSGGAPEADRPADRQDADDRGLRLPAQPRPAVRLPGQRTLVHRQLPQHALQDDRTEVHAQPGAGAGAGRALHPARRP